MSESHNLDGLFAQFGFAPHDKGIFDLAFTHSSYNGMIGTAHQDYERLEFLGDSVVGMVVSELCYVYHPDMDQGRLSVLKAQFIQTKSEASYALRLSLDRYIRVGSSFQGKVSDSLNLLEDVFESFIGAVYLDQGEAFAYSFVRKIFDQDVKDASIRSEDNPKSELQEAMQAEHKESVTYRIVSEAGPSHDRHFVAAVFFDSEELGRGEGHSKKEAEAEAARDALSKKATASGAK